MRRIILPALVLLSGCSMTPRYDRPAAPVPISWPIGDAYLKQSEAALPSLSYRDVVRDPRLMSLIDTALASNRDLRIAAANVAAARASYDVQRAGRLPQVDAGVSAGATGGSGATNIVGRFGAELGITAFEIDLFGRVAALTAAEQDRYFATEAGARATRIALIGDIATTWVRHAADATLLRIAQDTARNAQRSLTLTQARLKGGVAPRTDVRQAEQVLATAQADMALQQTAVAQDINALQLLIGAPVDPALLPVSMEDADTAIAPVQAGVGSDILLRRPDVVQAEYELQAANAAIGAARAAKFPRITLTGALGLASDALGALFSGGAFSWSGSSGASYPIFSGGSGRAGVRLSEAQRDAALATYERAIQTAFREVSDALARQGTIGAQLAANRRLVDAASDTARLTDARYRGGVASYLESLDAQRALYAAQRTLVATRQVETSNRIALYRALATDRSE